jgi:hypothetical protein
MSCQTILNSLSAHLDGCLTDGEWKDVVEHLGVCPACSMRLEQLALVRARLNKLPRATPPANVTAALRVIASRERARVLARKDPVGYFGGRLRLLIDNLMRPLALPLAGGLVSAMLLFSILVPSFLVHQDPRINDRLLTSLIYTPPTVKEQVPFELMYEMDATVAVDIDAEGRAVGYTLSDGTSASAQERRMIESNLLWTQFVPATAFGRPTLGKMFLSFTRTSLTIPSKS